ncbi:hypothetical protein K474DRAFT_1710594 [Panus rudis PR-1116 ss-1]|nr:hypothetical protein K474DRAFT_1710594 [Panus rudis PR-1116 ss-1]
MDNFLASLGGPESPLAMGRSGVDGMNAILGAMGKTQSSPAANTLDSNSILSSIGKNQESRLVEALNEGLKEVADGLALRISTGKPDVRDALLPLWKDVASVLPKMIRRTAIIVMTTLTGLHTNCTTFERDFILVFSDDSFADETEMIKKLNEFFKREMSSASVDLEKSTEVLEDVVTSLEQIKETFVSLEGNPKGKPKPNGFLTNSVVSAEVIPDKLDELTNTCSRFVSLLEDMQDNLEEMNQKFEDLESMGADEDLLERVRDLAGDMGAIKFAVDLLQKVIMPDMQAQDNTDLNL